MRTPLDAMGTLLRQGARSALALAALLLALPLAAQTCSSDPKPKLLVTRATGDAASTPALLRSITSGVRFALNRSLGAGIGYVHEDELQTLIDKERLVQLLGTDSTSQDTVRELSNAVGATDWILATRVASLGDQRQVALQVLDARRGGVAIRGATASFPVSGGDPLTALETAVARIVAGLDCELRRLRVTPVAPQLQLLLQPTRGRVGQTMAVTVRLTDLGSNRAPEPNRQIQLEYTTPQGQVLRNTVTTDETGTASDTLVLGAAHPRAGMVKARFVRSDGYVKDSSPINYYVLPAAGQLNLSADKAQLRPTGSDTVKAELRHAGAAVNGAAINLSATAGAVGAASVLTNSAGEAGVPYVAPSAPSLVDVRATATLPAGAGSAQGSLSYVVDAGVVMSLAAGGDTAIFGSASLKVDLEREQRAVAGATVDFSVTGGGTLSASSAATDSVGRAEVLFAAPSRAGTSTISASVTLDGQTYTRSVTVRYTDPLDAITREIADVKEAIYLDPSDANLSRLDRLRTLLLARGEGARAEALLGDNLVSGQLYCTHQRAHDECAAGSRGKAESTLRLLKGVSSGSTVVSEVFERSSASLRRCPYPLFINQTLYVENASIHDIAPPGTPSQDYPAYAFLSMEWNDDGSVKNVSWQVEDRNNPRRFAYGYLPVNASGTNFSGRASIGNVEGLYGNYFMASMYQANATGSTASFSISPTSASGQVMLYQVSFDGVPQVATVSFSTTTTLPQPPDPAMCRHASLPQPEGSSAPPPATWRR